MIDQPDGPYDENELPRSVPPWEGPSGTPGTARTRTVGRIIALCLAFAIVFAVSYRIGVATTDDDSSATSAPRNSTPSPGRSQGPAARPSSLPGLLVQPRDTTSALSVHLLPGGDQVDGQPTLDLCNGSFPSESLRVSRLQDVALDASGSAVLSTEAVLYQDAAATKQAFHELRGVAASCPKGPVTSPVSGSTFTTTFHKPPDGAWPETASVEREAFSLTMIDAKGASTDSVAVYLRRGRVLLGVYFSKPDGEQPPIDGHTTVADIVSAFATRMAQLPESFVSGATA
jgi:hypothetical protein